MERIIPDVMKPVVDKAKQTTASENINPMFEQEHAADDDCPDCKTGRLHEHTKKETARFENVNEGLCPSCGQQMRLSTANGIPVHVCMEHSVVMPIRDPEPLMASKESSFTQRMVKELQAAIEEHAYWKVANSDKEGMSVRTNASRADVTYTLKKLKYVKNESGWFVKKDGKDAIRVAVNDNGRGLGSNRKIHIVYNEG